MRAEAAAILDMIKTSRNVLMVSHKDADGDTLGSALAMCDVVAAMGKSVAMRVPPPVPQLYSFLPGFELINQEEGSPPDLVLVMDSSNLDRLSDTLGELPDDTRLVNIDHHVSNTMFGQVNLVVAGASSTAEVTFDLFKEWGVEITPAAATNLYCGIFTDTGGYRHENTTYRALSIGAELVSLGADPAGIAMRVYKNRKISTIKLQALVMATVGFDSDDRLVYGYVTQAMLEKTGAQLDEADGMIDQLNSVDGLELALFFKEMALGVTKASIRSRGQANANALASQFGGGGHERAAGVEVEMPLEQAMEAILAQARRMISDSQR
jgi:bifunctional oligoribonuclease and PAP phosphatase NrnA